MMTSDWLQTSTEVSNLVEWEHVNLRVPDQLIATAFYAVGLGCTRDPYCFIGLGQMWMNLGRQQFHLSTGPAQVFRGTIGVAVPNLDATMERLKIANEWLSTTKFGFAREEESIAITCPWGNRFRAHEPASTDSPRLGLSHLEVPVEGDQLDNIGRFYVDLLRAHVVRTTDGVRVGVGPYQSLIFKATSDPLAEYDGHHISVYVADFAPTRQRFAERSLVSEYTDESQFRFADITHPESDTCVFELEHEVRATDHPNHLRTRTQTNRDLGPASKGWVDVITGPTGRTAV
jgi:hypothetical protein